MSLKLSMARRKLTIAERWQANGMSNNGMSSRNIAVQFNVNHTVIGRLIQRYHQTGR
jgi:IS30 family transposase